MKQHLSDLKTAFYCIFFIMAAGLGSMLFTIPQAKPLAVARVAQEGLEIFTLAR